jgi:putative membrane protein insertion efficiency factor
MAKFALWLITFYRRRVSPLTRPSCRFIPSCSEYAYQSIEKYGFLRGGLMALWRILRCNPFSKGGYDPVK